MRVNGYEDYDGEKVMFDDYSNSRAARRARERALKKALKKKKNKQSFQD